MEQIALVTAVNNNYVLPLAVMMRSVVNSLSADACVNFSILTLGLSKESRLRLERSVAGLRLNYEEVRIDPSALKDLKVDGHVSLETYFRLVIPRYLDGVEKVLYLDADVIVCHSLLELYREQFNGLHLLAVPHASKRSGFFSSERGVPSYRALGIPGKKRTFNAGVMLLNLDAWRRSDTTGSIIKYLHDYREKVLWWDQDGLNAVLHDKWRSLPAKWNVMASHFNEFKNWEDSLLDSETFDSIRRDPGIIHYSFVPKPWSPEYAGPFLEHWKQAVGAVSSIFKDD